MTNAFRIDQSAIDTLLNLAEEYKGHSKNVASQTGGAVKGAHTDDSLQTAETDLKVREQILSTRTAVC